MATVNCNYGYLDLDRNGVVLDSYKSLKTMQIPMITGAAVHDLYIGDEVVMYSATERPVQIRLGKLERLDEKARLTEDFLKDLATNPHPVEYVDFNYTTPFIKLAQ